MNTDFAQYRSLAEANHARDAAIMADLMTRDQKIQDVLNGVFTDVKTEISESGLEGLQKRQMLNEN